MAPRPPRNSGRADEIDLEDLKRELEHEKRLRDTIEWSNAELEHSIEELEEELEGLESSPPQGKGEIFPKAELDEWYVRLESQLAVNEQLRQQRKWLELELQQAKQQASAGSFPEAMNFDLDSLTEAELIRLVKHLERGRTDLYSTLRDLEWKLDKEGKEFHRLSETRNMYQAELRHYNRTMERLRSQQIHSGMEQGDVHGPLNNHTGLSRWGAGSGIKSTQRIIDARKGPIRKTVGVKLLPKIQNKNAGAADNKQKGGRRRRKKSPLPAEDAAESPTVGGAQLAGEAGGVAAISTEATTDDSGLVPEPSSGENVNQGSKESDHHDDSKDDTEDKDTEE